MTAPAGWYPQPDGRERWWDGAAWTPHERAVPAPPQAPVADSRTAAAVAADPSAAPSTQGPALYVRPFEQRGGIRWGLFDPVWSTFGGICLIVVALPLLLFSLLSLVTGSVLSAIGMGLMGIAFIGCGIAFLYDASVGRRLRRTPGR